MSRAQMHVFEEIELAHFYARVLRFAEKEVPQYGDFPPQQLRRRLPRFHRECQSLGMHSERSVAFLFCASLRQQRNLLRDPQWRRTLQRRGLTEEQKITRILNWSRP